MLGGLAIVLLGNYPAAFISDFFSAFGYQSAASLIFGEESLAAVLLEIGVTALLVAVYGRSWVFRGIGAFPLCEKYGIGCFHCGLRADLWHGPYGLFHRGIRLHRRAWCLDSSTPKTNNLWLAVWIHALNNLIASWWAVTLVSSLETWRCWWTISLC